LRRFIDENPEKLYENTYAHLMSADNLYEEIRQNLEHLLNARSKYIQWPDTYKELQHSIVNYGIADFTNSAFSNSDIQQKLCDQINTIIAHFENRLKKINVMITSDSDETDRTLKLRIEATMNLKPLPKSTVFESSIDMNKYQFTFD
jgi:type VI secretion system protein ImpF